MTKIGLPVSTEMASQFENYMADQHAIVDEMDLAMNQLGRLLGDADLGEQQSFELYGKVLDILNGEGESFTQAADGLQQDQTGAAINAGENIQAGTAINADGNIQAGATVNAGGNINTETAADQIQNQTAAGEAQMQQTAKDLLSMGTAESGAENASLKNTQMQTDTLEQILDQNGLDHLKRLLQNIPTLTGNTDLFEMNAEEDVFVDTMSGEDAGKKTLELAQTVTEPEVNLKQP